MTKSLRAQLTAIASQAFADLGLDPTLGEVVPSQRPELGQFQCNGALPAAKAAKRNPREIAGQVEEKLEAAGIFAELSLAGPGFINMRLRDDFLTAHVTELAQDPTFGSASTHDSQTVVIDFGGPNVAKAMHVGHLRSSIIGECLQRLGRFMGDKVVSDVHLGDWGLPMGMLITEIKLRQPDLPYFKPDLSGPYPASSPVSIDDLQRLYPEAANRCKSDEAALEEARQATFELQQGRPGYVALWKHMVDVSMRATRADFDALGVSFDLWYGESTVNDRIPPMVERLKAAGRAEESEGALVIFVARDDDKADVPPLVLLKSDGGVMYGTTDLATIEMRVAEQDPDKILYVVDGRQALHFEQVFRSARKCGLVKDEVELTHVGFGTVNGKDGKPFKTRAGGVLRLADLIRMATEEAGKRLIEAGLAADFGAGEKAEIARKVGLAAIKFADLSNHRTSNYIFDLERFTRFEGKTGPYLLYAAVRIKSLLRKAADQGFAPGELLPPGDVERDLMLTLSKLPDAAEAAYDKYTPNVLCEFAYTLAQAFNRFYHDCHILSESDAALQASRLALCELTLREMETILTLLGIETPERM